MAKEKSRNGKRWTEARFRSFIKGALRQTSRKWQPIGDCLKAARRGRGEYECNGCGQVVPATTKEGRTRVKNIHVDHIDPVIDPDIGFVDWDSVIERLFVEINKLQVLCSACHTIKTNEEKSRAKTRRLKLKQEEEEDLDE